MGCALPTPYLRSKAAVAVLLPEPVRDVLPARKLGYAANLATVTSAEHLPTLARYGIVEATVSTADTAQSLTLLAMESWLSTALARGLHPGALPIDAC